VNGPAPLPPEHTERWTTASRSYDHPDTMEIDAQAGRDTAGKTWRRVAIPLSRLQAQCDRYSSGFHAAIPRRDWHKALITKLVSTQMAEAYRVIEVERPDAAVEVLAPSLQEACVAGARQLGVRSDGVPVQLTARAKGSGAVISRYVRVFDDGRAEVVK